jgi:hypothetical protein
MPPEEIRGAADRWRRLAVAAWAAVLLVVCGRGLISARAGGVYPIFADAGRSWLQGIDLYPESCRPDLDDRFRYSPAVAALFAPFSLLPDRVGGCLWRILNAAAFLGAFAWWCRVFSPLPLRGKGSKAALWLLLLPLSVGSMNNGQSNPLVAGLLLAAVAGVARERWNLAAVCVTAACLFKGYPLAIGLLLAAVYPRQFGPRLLLALAAGVALPFALESPGYVARAYADWLGQVSADDRSDVPVINGYRDLWQLIRLAELPVSRGVYLGLQLATAAGVAALCVAGRAARWPRGRLLTALLALGTCWMMLCGPATESCTYILLAPVLAWAVVEGWQAGRPRAARYLPAAALVLLTLASVACWFPSGKTVHGLGVQPLAALLLTVGLVAEYVVDLVPRAVRGGFGVARAGGDRPA